MHSKNSSQYLMDQKCLAPQTRGEWIKSSHIRREIELDEFVVMPNHVHGIVIINNNVNVAGAQGLAPVHTGSISESHGSRLPRSLGSFVTGFKSSVTIKINEICSTPGCRLWQRNYYDRIIRNDHELMMIFPSDAVICETIRNKGGERR